MEVTAGLAESNGSLMPGLWRDSLQLTCGMTACTPGSSLGPMLGNEYHGKNFTFTLCYCITMSHCPHLVRMSWKIAVARGLKVEPQFSGLQVWQSSSRPPASSERVTGLMTAIGGATIEALRLVPPQIMGPWSTLYSMHPQIFSICPKTSSHFFSIICWFKLILLSY